MSAALSTVAYAAGAVCTALQAPPLFMEAYAMAANRCADDTTLPVLADEKTDEVVLMYVLHASRWGSRSAGCDVVLLMRSQGGTSLGAFGPLCQYHGGRLLQWDNQL